MKFADRMWNFIDKNLGADPELKMALGDAVNAFLDAAETGDRNAMREARAEAREARDAIREARKEYIDAFKAVRDDAKEVRNEAKEALNEARAEVREAREAFREARKSRDEDAIEAARAKLDAAREARAEAREVLDEAREVLREARDDIREARDAWRDGGANEEPVDEPVEPPFVFPTPFEPPVLEEPGKPDFGGDFVLEEPVKDEKPAQEPANENDPAFFGSGVITITVTDEVVNFEEVKELFDSVMDARGVGVEVDFDEIA